MASGLSPVNVVSVCVLLVLLPPPQPASRAVITSVVYYKCLYSSVIPELDLESMFIPLDSSLRWNDINILDASRYIRDTTLAG